MRRETQTIKQMHIEETELRGGGTVGRTLRGSEKEKGRQQMAEKQTAWGSQEQSLEQTYHCPIVSARAR